VPGLLLFVAACQQGPEPRNLDPETRALPPAPPPPRAVFHADHPFVFVIRDRASGSILFLGRVTNPVST
jgi:serpin B